MVRAVLVRQLERGSSLVCTGKRFIGQSQWWAAGSQRQALSAFKAAVTCCTLSVGQMTVVYSMWIRVMNNHLTTVTLSTTACFILTASKCFVHHQHFDMFGQMWRFMTFLRYNWIAHVVKVQIGDGDDVFINYKTWISWSLNWFPSISGDVEMNW